MCGRERGSPLRDEEKELGAEYSRRLFKGAESSSGPDISRSTDRQ